MRSNINNRFAVKSFFLFLIVTYLPGLILYPFFIDAYHKYYSLESAPHVLFLASLVLFLFLFMVSNIALKNFKYTRIPTFSASNAYSIFLLLLLLYLLSSIYFYVNFSSTFRHHSRLHESGYIVQILFFLKYIAYLYVLMALIHIINGRKIGRKSKYILLICFLSSILSLVSSLQVVMPIIIVIILLFPHFFTVSFVKLKWKVKLLLFLLIPLIALMVVLVGIGNKIGYDYAFSKDGLVFLMSYLGVLVPRISTGIFSAATLTECCLIDPHIGLESLDNIIGTISNRFDLILGHHFDKEVINTISRDNYLRVFSNHAERAGGTPGVIASMFYTPLYPLTIFFVPAIIALILRVISYHVEKKASYNIFSLLATSYLLMNFYESPLNILYIFEPLSFMFIVLISIRLFNIKKLFLI